jgi:hypothetical protein
VKCAIGIVAHTGWAAAISIGAGAPPRLLDRRRVELVDGGFEVAGVFHAAAELPLAQAKRLVADVRKTAERNARASIGAIVDALRASGGAPRACAIVGSAKELPDLAAILASHALIHTAEGDLYRSALARGAEQHDLEVVMVSARDLDAHVGWMRAMGREAGPPWGKDQKLAAVAAARLL